ncbi:hypothetical protein ARSEF4850_009992 [Beauveria asiatica]
MLRHNRLTLRAFPPFWASAPPEGALQKFPPMDGLYYAATASTPPPPDSFYPHHQYARQASTSHTTLLRSPLSAARWVADRMNRPGYGQGCWVLGTTIESHPSNVYGSLVAVWVVDRVDSFAWASATIWWAPRSGRDAYCQKVVARKIWRLDRHGDADGRGEAIVDGQTQPAIA